MHSKYIAAFPSLMASLVRLASVEDSDDHLRFACWATLAKLLHYQGTRPAEALRYAERALGVVRRTHAVRGAVRGALERVRGEASMERLSAVASHLTSTRPPPRVAGGLSFHHNSSAAADAKGALLRVGVVGAGLKGTQWARAFAIHPRCAVVAVADTDEDNRALFAERFGLGAESAHADYEEMLRTQRLDIVAPILPVEPNPAVVRTPPARSLTPPGLSPR